VPEVRLDLRQRHQHLVEVTLRVVPRQGPVRLRLPAWTPGSYLIRDYVRNLEGLEAFCGERPLALQRLGVAAWQLELPSGDPGELTLRYRILATELSVRTCHLNADHGFLALAAVVLQVEGERWSPHSLELLLPDGWQPFLPLPRGDDGRWQAADYDQLIDTPLEAGPHPVHAFTVAGVPHRWVSWGDDLPQLDRCWLADVARVCEQCCRLMGEETPASGAYLFVLHLLEHGYGGLEHDDASVLVFSRRQLEEPRGRRKLLQLVAHEYLHQWNVRRLRPAELRPYDYDAPTIISSLWFAEGVTSYVDQLLPVAAGISAEEDLLEDLGADLSRFLLTPGRAVQSLRLSSQEAWVKLYRQDAHSSDNQISYYLKGAVIALVLDLHLRRHGSWLGAVLQQLWRSHGRCQRGYSEADLLAAFGDHAPDLETLLPTWLDGLEDPPLEEALAEVGLLLRPELAETWNPGWDADLQDGILQLRRVARRGAAQRAGLQVGDELLALAGRRLRSSTCLAAALRAGTENPPALPLWISRDGRVRELLLTPDPPAVQRWSLERDPHGSAQAQERRQRWCRLLP
jgi:predicted metalloprotease with PDZ domain